MIEYDDTEARHLLAAFAAKTKPYAPERGTAAERLIDALYTLAMPSRPTQPMPPVLRYVGAVRDPGAPQSLTLTCGNGVEVWISAAVGKVFVRGLRGHDKLIEVPLDYDPVADMLVGKDADTYLRSIPGQPMVVRRPALAVVVEAAVAVAKGTT